MNVLMCTQKLREVFHMYRRKHRHQLSLEDIFFSCGGKHSGENPGSSWKSSILEMTSKNFCKAIFYGLLPTSKNLSHGDGCINHQGASWPNGSRASRPDLEKSRSAVLHCPSSSGGLARPRLWAWP